MKRINLLSVVVLLALAIGACAPATTPAETSTPLVPVTGQTETPVVAMTDTATEAATTEAPTDAPTTAATQSTGMTVSTSSSPNVAEPFLVDDQGRALYMFMNDTQNSGMSACTGDCLVQWPAAVATGPATPGEGVDASLLGTITRDDGTTQLTYNGWPLYYYAGDVVPGDMLGQGMEGVWFLVSGAGTAIQ